MTRRRLPGLLASLLICLLLAPAAQAQHAKFVLFGDPNPKAANVPEEQKAVHPITAPFFHEDSFITSDIRLWAIYHDFPRSSAIGGGNGEAVAAQLRLAITDTLQLVAYKDGYLNLDTTAVDEDGMFDLAAGLKWNFLQDWDNQFHAAVGAGYEFRTGEGNVLQNDAEARFWISINKGFDKLHLGATLNGFIGLNEQDGLGNSDRISWHLHADYALCKYFSPVFEVNGYHIINAGFSPLPFQGVDVANLGGETSEEVITAAPGFELRPLPNIGIRAAYEFPITREDDLFGYRWTGSVVISF
jgi:hypothetical protein